MATAMRVFVAVELPDDVKRHIGQSVESLGSTPGLSVVKPHRMHVTLAFLGDVTQQTVANVTTRLGRAANRTAPFELTTDQIGRFGSRVLYLSLTGDTDQLRRLSDRTVAAAARAGIDMGADKFRPHITLARARSKLDVRELVAATESPKPRPWNVTSFTLIRSHLGADPRYESLAVFPLPTTTLHA